VPLIAYASRTGTRRNLCALRRADWRLIVSATGCLRNEGFRYALDNGAWTAYTQGRPFDESKFVAALHKLGRDADWTVLPDIVAGGAASLATSLRWMRRCLDESPRVLLAVQDGMRVSDVRPFLGERVGIFVGGSTTWKLQTLLDWGHLGQCVPCWVHVGRVNSAQRIMACAVAGTTSFDGTSATRYAVTLPRMEAARRKFIPWRYTDAVDDQQIV
jgi:hypothetical protein